MKNSMIYFILAFSMASVYCYAQDLKTNLTGKEILERTIKYHDPNGLWDNYKGKLFEVTVFASNYVVKENIEIDKPNDFYLSTCFQDFGTLKRGIDKGKNIFSLNGKPDIPEDIKENWGISDDGIKQFREQHYGHFGLPMVYKKSGMTIQDEVKIVDFDGRRCYAVTFIGKPDLIINSFYTGEQILYIDMNNFSMRGLRWKMPETEGVQIFEGEVDINGIKIVHVKCAFDKDGNALGSSINLPISTGN
jgi:hypothetical protein